MKRFFWIPCFGLILGLAGSQSGFAANPSDFFCKAADYGKPIYYEKIVKTCGTTTETSVGICGLMASCTYIGEGSKFKATLKALKTEEERIKYVKDNLSDEDDWFPTNLTCKGAAEGG